MKNNIVGYEISIHDTLINDISAFWVRQENKISLISQEFLFSVFFFYIKIEESVH